jgi:hypothetical protein
VTNDEESPYSEPPYLEGLNNLGEVIEGIRLALQRPERFTTAHLQRMAHELEEIARRYGVYEPLE